MYVLTEENAAESVYEVPDTGAVVKRENGPEGDAEQ